MRSRERTYPSVCMTYTHPPYARACITRGVTTTAGSFHASGAACIGFATLRSATLHTPRPAIASGFGGTSEPPLSHYTPPDSSRILLYYVLFTEELFVPGSPSLVSLLLFLFKLHNKHTIKLLHVNETFNILHQSIF